MEKLKGFLKSEKWAILSLLVSVIVMAFCPVGVLMADVVPVPSGGVNPSPGQQGLETQLPGAATTVSTVADAAGDLIQPAIDKDILLIATDDNVLDTIKRRAKRQIRVDSFEVEHYMIDEKRTSGVSTAAVAKATGRNFTIQMSSADADLFSEYRTAMIPSVSGYDTTGQTEIAVGLMLFCVGKTDEGMPRFMAVNGPKANKTDEFCTTPAIPAGSKIICLGSACYETQERISPSTIFPVSTSVYLQKKICNSIVSDYFDSQTKRIPFQKAQIANAALRDWKLENCRTAWLGVKSKFKVESQDKNMGPQYVYCSEGVRWQIKRDYALNGKITLADIIHLAKFKFTGLDCSGSAIWLVGKELLADIQTIDMTLHKDISMTKSEVFGIKCKKLETIFGDIFIVHDKTLNKIGLEKCGALLDEDGLVRYWRKNETSKSEKVEGEEAKREIVMDIDALALKGYSHVWVDGTGVSTSVNSMIKSVASLPTDAAANDVVILTADVMDGGTKVWSKNDILVFTGTVWKLYDGNLLASA